MRKTLILAAALVAGLAAPVIAQDSDWKAERAAGKVGEQPDGYLGIVGAGTPALTALVSKVNIQRKSIYTGQAAATNSTVAEFALTTGCNQILNTPQGTKYRTPSGEWKTRTAAAPERSPSCV